MRVGSQPQIEKSRSGNIDGAHSRALGQLFSQPCGEIPRWYAYLLPGLQCHVGGVVPVLGIARAVNRHGVRKRAGVETTVCQNAVRDRSDEVGERGGGHDCESKEEFGSPGSPGLDPGSLH